VIRRAAGPATVLLVVAKAPVPGQAKTRLCPPATPAQAAGIAAAALLDTLAAVRATPGTRAAVAFTGELRAAARAVPLRRALSRCMVYPQRGDGLAARLVAAHAGTARRFPGHPVLQLGMDTPQVTPGLLAWCAGVLCGTPAVDAVLGPARDGGWWALGLRDPRHAVVLAPVPVSRPDTGALTLAALRAAGLCVATLPELSDVDTMADARAVAELAPHGRFARAVATVPAPVPVAVSR